MLSDWCVSSRTCCPSPPPPVSPVQQQSRCVRLKIKYTLKNTHTHKLKLTHTQSLIVRVCVRLCFSELDRKLQAVSSLLSPESPRRRRRRRRAAAAGSDDVITSSRDDDDDDDVTIVTPPEGVDASSPYSREFPLKVRCRTDIHKICVQSVRPLGCSS